MSDTILVADDDQATRDTLSRFFGGKGFRVETVSDGTECIDVLRKDPPGVLFLDLDLPGKSGLDILRTIDNESIEVLVITISGHTRADLLAEESLKLGAAEFIGKPFDLDALEADLVPRLPVDPTTTG